MLYMQDQCRPQPHHRYDGLGFYVRKLVTIFINLSQVRGEHGKIWHLKHSQFTFREKCIGCHDRSGGPNWSWHTLCLLPDDGTFCLMMVKTAVDAFRTLRTTTGIYTVGDYVPVLNCVNPGQLHGGQGATSGPRGDPIRPGNKLRSKTKYEVSFRGILMRTENHITLNEVKHN